MALFTKKTWKNRLSEYPNRRKLTKENGTTELVTVARSEGTVSQEGDAFSAANMNNLENRISKAIGTGDIPEDLGTDIISAINALNTGTDGTIDLAPICPGASVGEVKWQSIGKVNILSIEMTLKNDFAYGGTISLVTLQNKPLADVISAGAAGGLPVNIFASSSSGYLYVKNNSGTKIAAGSVVRGQIAYMC